MICFQIERRPPQNRTPSIPRGMPLLLEPRTIESDDEVELEIDSEDEETAAVTAKKGKKKKKAKAKAAAALASSEPKEADVDPSFTFEDDSFSGGPLVGATGWNFKGNTKKPLWRVSSASLTHSLLALMPYCCMHSCY
jgi:hypothetical protein